MNRNAGLLLKYSREMKWRSVYSPRHLIERDAFTHPGREVRLCSFSTFRVIRIRTFSFRPALDSTMHECGFEHVSNKLQRRHISPQRLEGIHVRRLETLHELTMTPEDACFAWSCKELKRLLGMFVDRWIELADDIVEHTR